MNKPKLLFKSGIILILLGVGFFCTQSSAQETKPLTEIRVGIYQNPPKIWINEMGIPEGIFVDLLTEMARNENWKLTYVPANWNQCLINLETGIIDLLPDVAFTAGRSNQIDFNKQAVIESWSQGYVKKGVDIKRLPDIAHKRVAVVEGSIQQKTFNQLMKGFDIPYSEVSAHSFQQAFSMVHNDSADIALTNYSFGETYRQAFQLEKTNLIFNPASLHFGVKKGTNQHLINTIDSYLSNWKNTPNSLYYQTLNNYLKNALFDPPRVNYQLITLLFIGIGLIALTIILMSRKQVRSRTKKLRLSYVKLREGENKFKQYIDNAPYGIFVTNEKGEYLEANSKACQITGYSDSEIIGLSISNLTAPEHQSAGFEHFTRVVHEGQAIGDFAFITKNGEKRYWTVRAVRLSQTRYLGFVNDITDEKNAAVRINRLVSIVEHSLNEIYLFDTVYHRFIDANTAALNNTGYSLLELKQMTPLHLKLNLSEDQFSRLIDPLLSGEKGEITFETQHFRKDGSWYEAEVLLQLIADGQEQLFAAIVLDITERKKAETELKKLKDHLEIQVTEKTKELNARIAELEHFYDVTIERELRMEELRNEIKVLKEKLKTSGS